MTSTWWSLSRFTPRASPSQWRITRVQRGGRGGIGGKVGAVEYERARSVRGEIHRSAEAGPVRVRKGDGVDDPQRTMPARVGLDLGGHDPARRLRLLERRRTPAAGCPRTRDRSALRAMRPPLVSMTRRPTCGSTRSRSISPFRAGLPCSRRRQPADVGEAAGSIGQGRTDPRLDLALRALAKFPQAVPPDPRALVGTLAERCAAGAGPSVLSEGAVRHDHARGAPVCGRRVPQWVRQALMRKSSSRASNCSSRDPYFSPLYM